MTTIRRRLTALLLDLVESFSGEHRPWQRAAATGRAHRRPARHEGATERFGTELRALRDLEVSPELVTDIETELRWGLIWYEFERNMQAEIDRVFAPYLPVPECRDFDDLRDLVGLRELAPA